MRDLRLSRRTLPALAQPSATPHRPSHGEHLRRALVQLHEDDVRGQHGRLRVRGARPHGRPRRVRRRARRQT